MQPLHKTLMRDCDVSQHFGVSANATNLSATAISSKTNAQSNGWERRMVYTSTPKYKVSEQQQLKQRNDVGSIRLRSSLKAAQKKFSAASTAVKWQAPIMDARLKGLILLFGIAIIGYQFINLASPLINDSVPHFCSWVQTQLSASLEWCREHQLGSKLRPLLCGFLVSAFFYGIVFMDSAVPGINPPAPHLFWSKERTSIKHTLDLSYMMAMGSGVIVTLLMYLEL
ncbi:uncharacterized protein LOC133840205 [Drosophila sulfurigaster albostrigata]|uniref:uncharacterized protein LOC133840205 n=1 Tax=Drosophila sulfurigaster albostrigata TaxID=89887 RepID=UPI002D21B7F7|nr:uncharacterized protein LOC133840205 [Drosophila sulfurigaster albostrigata]